MTHIAGRLAKALDAEDYDSAGCCLAENCRYTIAGREFAGRAAILQSYREAGDWAASALDGVRYESSVEALNERKATITFVDHLTHGGRTHTHCCRQHVICGADGLIESIVHEDLPGEKESLDRFFAATGIQRDRSGPPDLRDWFGDIDIYLFDQILRGRFRPGMKILDAGAGGGRNLVYFLRSGFDVCAVDRSPDMIDRIREMAARLAPGLPPENFRYEDLRGLSFDSNAFDAVVSSAVLHFAADEADFAAILNEMWRVLRPGGFLFARLASMIGIESRIEHLGGRRYSLPDGSDRFLVDEAFLIETTRRLNGRLMDPIKTVNVQGQRCMTNWCLEKTQ